ncbi:50S ribosomal protein L14e [Candidatus Woesearchaeota archaeon]|nr:50S ribosomal protein L14e [Candidatus Woesearchaeota archaeon]
MRCCKNSCFFFITSDLEEKMIEVGRLVTKIAGRDAGCKAIIVEILDDKYVLLDGETRRRKCNILHIEPLNQKIEIKKNASHEEVAKVLKDIGIETRQTKPKPKTQKSKAKRKTPDQLRVQKEEKRKLRDIFRPKKKEEKAETKEATLEEKAGLVEEKHEHKSEKEEIKPKEKKAAPKKETPKKKE